MAASNNAARSRYHNFEEILPGQVATVVAFDNRKYLIGAQLATLLKRETFNLYRSMKIKNVIVSRATHEQLVYMVNIGAVRRGTHSVTLLDYESCCEFLRGAQLLSFTWSDIFDCG